MIIERAYLLSEKAHTGQLRESGEPYITHPSNVAEILFELGLDTATIAAGYLHDVVEDTGIEIEEVEEQFGSEIAMLVNGVTKISKIEISSHEERQAENLRKMLLAMAEDIRVILIKLADRLHNMRTLKYRSHQSQLAVSQETIEIYAPLAHRLGIFKIKWELEDLAFYYLYPDEYSDLAKKVSMRRQEREDIIESKIEKIRNEMKSHNIKGTIDGRPKHFYSIYNKMNSQDKPFEQIFDLTAIRLVVEDIRACYTILGIVHTIWTPMPGRFKDYIAMPKPNLYQSIHTTLMGEHGIPFEVQIRTREMHRTAEYGIAAHWKYKENEKTSTELDSKLVWLRQILEWQNETNDAKEFMNTIKLDLFSDEVFVFTPKGDVINLVVGASTLDFAYRIHSGVGNMCVGAKVNEKMVPLNTELKTGDIVSIITSKTGKPSRDWLKIVKSSHARNKIRAYFKKEGKEENLEKGKHMLEESVKRHNVSLADLLQKEWVEKYCNKNTFKNLEDVYAAIGYGGLATGQVLTFLMNEYRASHKVVDEEEIIVKKVKKESNTSNGVLVKGEKNMLVRFAQCCHPVQGDQIKGYITRGRGVSIHRSDCYNVKNIPQDDPRFIDVTWEGTQVGRYNARLSIIIADTPGLIVQISNAIQSLGVDLIKFNATVTSDHVAKVELKVRINDTVQLENLISKIRSIDGCVDIYRRTS
ncbi:MAG: bifunctional (p)ppGpp synthetase/guanosine-3',5'-bis(diphosphate) 3'-pyrophosphohydrolase [Clostridiales bacterium]|nr:bifunctional (p)ppGpp synthetase/guanosine-3',5'-bis(diphosphate) 3'-pyrophosphohydrolase [Clostridiales bacterium]